MDCQNQFKKTLNFHQFPQDTEHLEFQTSEGSIIRPGSEGGEQILNMKQHIVILQPKPHQ